MNCFIQEMRELLKVKKYKKAIWFYKQYNGIHNDITKTLYIKACTQGKYYAKAAAFIDDCNVYDHSIQMINTVIAFYGSIRNVNKAREIFDNIDDIDRTDVTISSMMKVYAGNDEYERVIEFYEEYSGRHNQQGHVIYIKSCCKVKKYDKVWKWMKHFRLKKDERIGPPLLTTLIDFYGCVGDTKMACEIFKKMPLQRPCTVTLSAMMKCYVNNGKIKDAIQLYDEYQGTHDDFTNNLYIKGCVKLKEYDKIEQLIVKLNINSVNIHKHGIELITTLIDYYGCIGKVILAEELFDHLLDHQYTSGSISAMMKVYINNNLNNKAIELYEHHNDKQNISMNKLYVKACWNFKMIL